MTPKEVLKTWIAAFNRIDIEALADLYSEDAVNHQVITDPMVGKAAIKKMFTDEFARAEMVCIEENIFEDTLETEGLEIFVPNLPVSSPDTIVLLRQPSSTSATKTDNK